MVDFYSDTNQEILKEFIRRNPDTISVLEKNASDDSVFIPKNELTKEAFADPVNKMFPVYNKHNTIISSMYIMAQADEVPMHVKEAAQEMCDVFGVDFDLVGFQKIASDNNVTLDETDFIFPEKRKLPVVDKETYNTSESVFLKVAAELNPNDLIIGARRFEKKAEVLGVKPSEEITRLSLRNGIDNMALSKEAENRYFETFDKGYLEIKEIAKTASQDDVPTIMFALFELDKKNEVEKVAETINNIVFDEKNDIITIGNMEIPTEKVANIPEDEWREVLPYEDISFFSSDEFDKKAFEEEVNNFTPHEKDIIISFVQKYL